MHASEVSKMEVEPILCSVPQGCRMIGIGTQGMYDLIGAGLVKAVKRGTRTLLVVASLHEYANSLPPATVAPPRKRKSIADNPSVHRNGPPRRSQRRWAALRMPTEATDGEAWEATYS